MNVLLFSAGIESTCLAYMLRPDACLTINYGQISAQGEIRAAKNIARHFALSHEVLTIDASILGTGQMAGKPTIEEATIPELWPFRNQFLITLAAMKFVGALDVEIIIGSVKNDSSHKDGTAEFMSLINNTLNMQEGGVKLSAPAIHLDSIELMRKSNIDVDVLDMTFSCFQAEYPCGQCRGCWKNEALRVQYFNERPSCHAST